MWPSATEPGSSMLVSAKRSRLGFIGHWSSRSLGCLDRTSEAGRDSWAIR